MKVLVKYEDLNKDKGLVLKEVVFDKINIDTYNGCEYISFKNGNKEVFEIGKAYEHAASLKDCDIDLVKLFNEIVNNFINTDKVMSLLNNMESFSDIYNDYGEKKWQTDN